MASLNYTLQQRQFVEDASALVADAQALLSAPAVGEQRAEYLAALRAAQQAVSRLEGITNPAGRAAGAEAGSHNEFERLVARLGTGNGNAIAAIRAGFPAAIVKDAGAWFDVPAARIRAILCLPETTAHTLAKRGAPLDAACSERIWRLADVLVLARDVFEDEAAAKAWLRTANRTFAGAAPMDYLDTEPGASAVRQVLNAIATGGAA